MQKNIFFLFVGIWILAFSPKSFAQTDTIPDEFCISAEEYQLFQLINDYRKTFDLPPIALSKSLSYVAKTHAHDLAFNYNPDKNCNMHSWSDKGNWTPICYPSGQSRKNNVWLKAKEIIGYPSEAREITYWSNSENSAQQIFNFWRENLGSSHMLLNQKEWSKITWKAIGIGMEKSYAVLWLGKDVDFELSTSVCDTSLKVLNINAPENIVAQTSEGNNKPPVYFISIASFDNREEAVNALKSYKEMGYPKAVLIEADDKIRIAIDYFTDKNEADQAIKKYIQKFKGAWVLTI